MTDPIADMLTRIRNAVSAKHTRVDMPASRLKVEIARILQDEGYIQGFKLLDDAAAANGTATALTKTLRLFLKYGPHGERLITGVERISRPGRRVYFGRDDVPEVLAGLGTSILTTSRGVMTGPRGGQGRRRRRSALQHLVGDAAITDMSRIGKKPIAIPKGRHRQGRRRRGRSAGPEGQAAAGAPAGHQLRARRRPAASRSARPTIRSSASFTAWRAASSPTPSPASPTASSGSSTSSASATAPR